MQPWWSKRVWVSVMDSRWVWLNAPRAQSTVEYALVGALVVMVAAAALTTLGGELSGVFGNISKTLSGKP